MDTWYWDDFSLACPDDGCDGEVYPHGDLDDARDVDEATVQCNSCEKVYELEVVGPCL